MTVALVRKPRSIEATEAPALRAWLMEQVHHEVRLRGQPSPRLVAITKRSVDSLDLDAVVKGQPRASLGKTWAQLASRLGVLRTYAILSMTAEDEAGLAHHVAVIVERLPDDRWWAATLAFRRDPVTGLGTAESWASDGEVDDLGDLGEVLGDLVLADPHLPPAKFMEPRAAQSDVRAAFGELPAELPVPNTVQLLIELAAHVSVDELLQGAVKGAVVVRIAGRAWEKWALGDELGMGLDEMIRHLANVREPKADGVALVQVAIRPEDQPPAPGIQIVAERAGMVGEAWIPLEFPEGRGDRPVVSAIHWKVAAPVTQEGLWIGIAPSARFDLGPLGAEA